MNAESPVVLHATRSAAFCHWFGFSRRLGALLAALYAAKTPLTAEQLADMIGNSPAGIWEQIHRLRRCMETEALDTTSAGYQLTEIGVAECQEAMRLMREGLAA